jgi:hypothetical protein
MWQSGNDYSTYTDLTDGNVVYQVMLGIQSVAPSQLQTVETDAPNYSDTFTLALPAISLDGVYTYTSTYDVVLQAYKSAPTLPTFLMEGYYEFEPVGNPVTYFQLRQQSYWLMTSGGSGQFYGTHYNWTFSPGWQANLNSQGVKELGFLSQVFTDAGWWNLVPDTNHEIITAGYGTYCTATGPCAWFTGSQQDYASTAYNPNGSASATYDIVGAALTVNMASFNGPVTARWFDPAGGTYTANTGPFANSGSKQFAPPGGNNASGDHDWVLVLKTEN